MRYSLLSRFRGGLRGSLVGEYLGSMSHGSATDASMLRLPQVEKGKPVQKLSAWNQIAICASKSLIRCGRLDLDDWLLECSKQQQSLLLLKTTATSNEAALAILPIALFFHEDQIKLRQQLLKAATVWLGKSEEVESVLAFSYAITQAVTEKLEKETLIPQTLAYLGTVQTPLGQQLEQVQILLKDRVGLEQALRQLRYSFPSSAKALGNPDTSLALAFYCFLSTPEDFRLCMSRAIRTGCQPQMTASLTGALAGTYNSTIGIPVNWHLPATSISSERVIVQLADSLLSVWSGVYQLSGEAPCQHSIVAAPHVIKQ